MKPLILLLLLTFTLRAEIDIDADLLSGFPISKGQKIFLATKRLEFKDYPCAHNPSIIEWGENFLLTFRYSPSPTEQYWLSYVVAVLLDRQLEPIGEPQIVDTRLGSSIPSQSEDARLFHYLGKTYIIYNDCAEEIWYNGHQRRDMYIAEITQVDGQFQLASTPLKLMHEVKYGHVMLQKNWTAFEWNETLLITYSFLPHEILYPDLHTGQCISLFETQPCVNWTVGETRPSSAPIRIGDEYLAFFHSAKQTISPVSAGWNLWHYFMGAYTFSKDPPFELTRMSPEPLSAKGFYTNSGSWKRVIYPGGFVLQGSQIYLAYGKDDKEVWIATLDKEALLGSLVPVRRLTHRVYEGEQES